jgi:hypothetical protein
MTVEKLIVKFKNFEAGYEYPPTLEEVQFLCQNEEHELFAFDYSLFRDIMDFRDHLELEA